jgi:hypothetical protein
MLTAHLLVLGRNDFAAISDFRMPEALEKKVTFS